MSEFLTLLSGGGLLFAGMVIGRLWPARRRHPRPPRPVHPICGCDHHLSYHDPVTGQCHGTEERSVYNKHGEWTGKEYVPCSCRQYSGPVPLSPEYFTPAIATAPAATVAVLETATPWDAPPAEPRHE